MTTMTKDDTARLSTRNKVGLGLAVLLAVPDLGGPLLTPTPGPGEQGPPMVVLLAGMVLAVITLAAVVWAWRSGNRVGLRIAAGARIVAALTSLPAFFVPDVPAGLRVIAATGVLITAASVYLMLDRPRTV